MNRIKISLEVLNYNDLIVDYNLNHELSSFFYALLKDDFPKLHDDKKIKNFVFSNIILPNAVYLKEGIALKSSYACILFSSTDSKKVESIEKKLKIKNKVYEVLNIHFKVNEVYNDDLKVMGSSLFLRTVTPACITINKEGKETFISLIDEPELFAEYMKKNIISKAKCENNEWIEIEIDKNSVKRKLIKFKNCYIQGFLFDFNIKCSPRIMSIVLYNGIGVKNAIGLGFVKIRK